MISRPFLLEMEYMEPDTVTITFTWLDREKSKDLSLPAYETTGSAGLDVCAAVETEISAAPGKIILVPTGFGVAIPTGYEIQVRPRSGLAVNHGITLINSPGTIDSDYRGGENRPDKPWTEELYYQAR